MIVERTVLFVSVTAFSLGTRLLYIVIGRLIGHGSRGIPGFSKRKKKRNEKDFVLTEAHTNTFCNVSIVAGVELLNYLKVSGVYG